MFSPHRHGPHFTALHFHLPSNANMRFSSARGKGWRLSPFPSPRWAADACVAVALLPVRRSHCCHVIWWVTKPWWPQKVFLYSLNEQLAYFMWACPVFFFYVLLPCLCAAYGRCSSRFIICQFRVISVADKGYEYRHHVGAIYYFTWCTVLIVSVSQTVLQK